MSVAAVPVVDFSKRRRRPQPMRAVNDGLRFVERTNVELRHIRYYIAVAEEQSIRRAAIRLNMAAPPLSVRMQKLEAEVGRPRTHNRVVTRTAVSELLGVMG